MNKATNVPISGNGASFLHDDNVAWNKFARFNLLFFPTANDNGLHSNACLKLLDNVACLLFLIPSDESVQCQDADLEEVVYQGGTNIERI